ALVVVSSPSVVGRGPRPPGPSSTGTSILGPSRMRVPPSAAISSHCLCQCFELRWREHLAPVVDEAVTTRLLAAAAAGPRQPRSGIFPHSSLPLSYRSE